MRVASVCSGVGGLDLGLHRAGHETVFLCEFDPWRRKVLKRHWPNVPIHHDLEELSASDIPPCDIVVGGTPCTNLSGGGRREGLEGDESRLFYNFAQLRLDLFERHGTAWSLWENVEGAFSTNGGRDFATVLAAHVGADVSVPAGGWSRSGVVVGPWGAAEWRLLDAQFFGVPQRRRRVFVVGHLGAKLPPSVLADTPRRGRHSASGEGAWADAPAGAGRGARVPRTALALDKRGPSKVDDNAALASHLVVGTLPARGRTGGFGVDPSMAADGHLVVTRTLTASHDASEDGSSRGTPLVAATLTAGGKAKDGVRPSGRRQEDDLNVVVADTLRSHPRPGSASPGAIALVPGIASTLKGHTGKGGGGLSPEDTFVPIAFHATQNPITLEGVAPCLTAGDRTSGTIAVAFSENQRGEVVEAGVAQSLGGGGGKPGQGYAAVRTTKGVRRLTPTECNRLMGWPDDWTYEHGPSRLDACQGWPDALLTPVDLTPDGRRYSADGDGVAAVVGEWIGLGLAEV